MEKVNKYHTLGGDVLLILSTLYLIPEIIFNAQLVNVAGSINSNFDAIHKVELFGRAISGIGVSLMLISLISAKHFKHSVRFFFFAMMITLVAWPVTFFGQKWAVDTFIIEPSTAEERQKATMAILLKDALANNAVNIDGIEFDPDAVNSPANQTFLTLFGGLLYADPTIQDSLDKRMRDIIRTFISARAVNQFDGHYADYTRVYKDMAAKYDEYLEGSQRYNDAINGIGKVQSDALVELSNKLKNGYTDYQNSVKGFQARAQARAQEYGPRIYDFFKKLEKCNERKNNKRCNEQLTAQYRQEIMKAGLGYIEPNYFLIVEDVGFWENLANTVVGGVLTGGMMTVLQGLSAATGGDGGWKDKKYYWTKDNGHYQEKFAAKMVPQFERENGYPVDIDSFEAFKNHESTRTKTIERFAKEGINLAENWKLSDTASLTGAVGVKVRRDAKAAWDREMNKMDLALTPNQEWVAFQKHADVQRILSERLSDYYVAGMRVDLNERQFQRTIMDPIVERQTSRLLQEYLAAERLFEDGAEYEQRGKNSLRAVFIPPISMSISLILICLTLVTLPAKYYALLSAEPTSKGVLLSGAAAVVILFIPSFMPNPLAAPGSNQTIAYFFDKMDENASPIYSGVLGWTLDAQPLMLPLGNAINDSSNVYKMFDVIEPTLASWDEQFTKESASWGRSSKDFGKSMSVKAIVAVPLIVDVNVPRATIKVMNIKPKFKQGIRLKPGRYDIEVRAPGYVTQRKWVRLSEAGAPISFKLERLTST
jgi:hypothetical protein